MATNLSRPLEHVTASYDDPAAWSRPTRDTTADLRDAPDLAAALPELLTGAMALMGTEAGNIQLLDPSRDSLVLVTQAGFGPEFVDHFAVVDNDDGSVCGRAASHRAQSVVADVRRDPAFTPHHKVFRAAGVRSVQSTPLVDNTGRLVGMISTHLPRPGRPCERKLRLMGLYSHFAGELVARLLGRPSPSVTAEGATVRLLTETVTQIFGAGLSLAAAQSLITDDAAAQRVRAGIAKLNDAVRTIHRVSGEIQTGAAAARKRRRASAG
ncbi:GAF domain-containing protein [Allokutzneria sp. A3M-2-11 16]|uniref:GAF domain-containing protein n=1 Tax=Allokutzneria sp. A3M-2-11 16 TaxID=2962043 RepID=UPI0020B780BA|nr:GAF domain-containing protein [Allokutzneria sp. A3M-2-11 16]MCP3804919.1 GAF domain-containing protein [Allokutzneria sp. A3M-2-11 16]